jgi:hypothetical protein
MGLFNSAKRKKEKLLKEKSELKETRASLMEGKITIRAASKIMSIDGRLEEIKKELELL